MARQRRTIGAFDLASKVVLDARPLSLLADDDRRMHLILDLAQQDGYAPVVSAVSFAEVRRTGKAAQRLRWLRSQVDIVPATVTVADFAATLLDDAGLDGHDNVVDALVVATATCTEGPVKVVSTDASHIPKLCHVASVRRKAPVEWVRV
ncbi:hypothetical protein [Streptomyces sp. CB03238]|uniref:hypothetical protein n=1 Tax=Streptomyces sp. CB03238 TaxID=1907777 RepID=UPI000A11F852|nr:hypothetical protein [Streptomyces sp. CB03238]ORT55504.1 hypothetical protein BKD26_32165 [Streptomyces sp. CB03238]